MPEVILAAGAVGGLLTGFGALAAWRKQSEIHVILRGNGQGPVDKMLERVLDQQASFNKLLVDHVADSNRHN